MLTLTRETSPRSSRDQISNGGRIDAVISCNLSHANVSTFVNFNNIRRLFGCQFCFPTSAFFSHVLNVINMSAKEKVLRVAARSVIASVKHIKTACDFTVSQFPRHSMRQKKAFVTEVSVPGVCQTSNPIPAFVWSSFFNLRPKTLFKRFLVPLHYPLPHEPIRFRGPFCIHRVCSYILSIKEIKVNLC